MSKKSWLILLAIGVYWHILWLNRNQKPWFAGLDEEQEANELD